MDEGYGTSVTALCWRCSLLVIIFMRALEVDNLYVDKLCAHVSILRVSVIYVGKMICWVNCEVQP
jgi:hypothetical protein